MLRSLLNDMMGVRLFKNVLFLHQKGIKERNFVDVLEEVSTREKDCEGSDRLEQQFSARNSSSSIGSGEGIYDMRVGEGIFPLSSQC